MNDKLKQIVFDKLYEDLKHVEIIPHNESIWFIDRKEKYWYFEYRKSGRLTWRWQFFSNFFLLFSIEHCDYQWIISEWVEEVLNCKVETSLAKCFHPWKKVEEVLNCSVETSVTNKVNICYKAEEVLNCRVETSENKANGRRCMVEEVLNYKVKTSDYTYHTYSYWVEEVLNYKSIRNEQ
jgi:hypothetical protein